jgi:hypothetical protein
MTDEKQEKKPLDMTTDEAIDFLFGTDGAQTLKKYVREEINRPPEEKKSKVDASVKSSRKEG